MLMYKMEFISEVCTAKTNVFKLNRAATRKWISVQLKLYKKMDIIYWTFLPFEFQYL